MSDILLCRIDTDQFYPQFLLRLRALLNEAMVIHKRNYWVVSGWRSWAEQDGLYAQGRSKPGPIVTNARGGQSAHNYGIAADLCLDAIVERKGLQPDYRPESYELLRALAPEHGLVWGGAWKTPDRPHVQWPRYVAAPQLAELEAKFSDGGGLDAVWQYIKERDNA